MTTNTITALFNTRGVRIPYEGLKNVVTTPDWNFHLDPPVMVTRHDFAQRLLCYRQVLPDAAWPDLKQFWSHAWEKYVVFQNHPTVSGLFNGPCLPIPIPAGVKEDHGTELRQVILPEVEASYREIFPERKFNNFRSTALAHQVSVVPESRHARLADAMAQGPMVGLYFPEALRGWSINACREQMATLPGDVTIVLPDAMIHGLALIGYPDILGRDYHTPGLDCAANTWQSPRFSLYFGTHDDSLVFGGTDYLSDAHGHCSGGLFLC